MSSIDRAIATNLGVLFRTVPSIRDGDPDAIHDARVATRRLDAALPLAWAGSSRSAWQEGAQTIRQLGKALGRVRDLDVAIARLPQLEARVPTSAATIATLRVALAREQWVGRRKLIKTLEQIPFERVPALGLVPDRSLSLRADRRWLAVEQALIAQADELRRAVVAASGVYFPKRAHRVRIETKKLRYVLELVTHARQAGSAVKSLKRAQEVLGELHDHQRLSEVVGDAKTLNKSERGILAASVEAATAAFFGQYLERRPQILDVCRQVRTAGTKGSWRPRTLGGTLLTAGAAVAPSAVLFLVNEGRRALATRRADSPRHESGPEHANEPESVPALARR